MLINIHTPPVIPNQVPVDARYGETIDLDSISICRPNNCNLRALCGALEQKLLPQTILPTKMSMQNANYEYYSIGGYTEGADAIFEMHNSASRLIEDHLSVINARMLNLTCQIATLRENTEGYVCIDPRY